MIANPGQATVTQQRQYRRIEEQLDPNQVKLDYVSGGKPSIEDLAVRYGCSKTGLRMFMCRHGIKRRAPGSVFTPRPAPPPVEFDEPDYPPLAMRFLLRQAHRKAEFDQCAAPGCRRLGVMPLLHRSYRICRSHFSGWEEWVFRHPAKSLERRWRDEQFVKRFSQFLYEQMSSDFGDEAECQRLLEAIRWPSGPVCPKCGTPVDRGRGWVYRCHRRASGCNGYRFSVTVGTPFHGSALPLTVWYQAIVVIATGIEVQGWQLAHFLGVSREAGCRMKDVIETGLSTGWQECPDLVEQVLGAVGRRRQHTLFSRSDQTPRG